jgi:hypothetical protein
MQHFWQQRPVQPDGRKEILVKRVPPLSIVENGEAAPRSRGAADHMNDDINTTEEVPDGVRDDCAAISSSDIGCYK